MRSVGQRAGAKHSKKTLAAFDEMHAALSSAMGVLDGLRAMPEGDEATDGADDEAAGQRARRRGAHLARRGCRRPAARRPRRRALGRPQKRTSGWGLFVRNESED